MTASVVEIVSKDYFNALTITTTPQPGDVIVVTDAYGGGSGGLITAVSGLGATWSRAAFYTSSDTSGTSKSVEVWIGLGATSAGTITITQPYKTPARRAFVVRGTSGTSVVASIVHGQAATLAGDSSPVASGQLVIDQVWTYPSGTQTFTHTPASGWTDQPVVTIDTYGRTLSGWAAPTAPDTYGTTWGGLRTGVNDASAAAHIVIGDGSGGVKAGDASLAGSVAASAAGARDGTGGAARTATATATAGGAKGVPGGGTLNAAATATARGVLGPAANAHLTATGTLTADGTPGIGGAAALAATVALTAAGTASTPSPSLTLAGVLPLPTATVTLTQPYQTAANNVGGRGRAGVGYATYEPPVTTPPATTAAPMVYDVAVAHTAATITGTQPTFTTTHAKAPAQRTRILVGGHDITYFRGVPTPEPDYGLVQPFLYGFGTLTLPQVLPAFERLGVGSLSWLKPGAKVKIQRVNTTTGHVVATDYIGYIIALNVDGNTLTCDLGGEVTGKAALKDRQPPIFREVTDIGHQAYRFVNRQGARFAPPLPEIGIKLTTFGGMSDLDFGNQLLAMAVDTDGRQFTVMPDASGTYRITAKDTTTIAATVYFDDARMVGSLKRDMAEEPNAVYASGVQADGRRVKFAIYPGLVQGTTPPYPFADGRTFGFGTTDADTDDPDGMLITAMLQRLTVMGYLDPNDAFDGYDANVVYAIKELQRDAGFIFDSGVVDKATWRALYDLDATGYSLDGARIMPAAEDPRVRVWNRTSSGALIRRNPAHDSHVLRVERTIDVGAGFSRRQIRQFARGQMSSGNNWVGTLTCNLALIAGEHTPGDPVTAADVLPARALRPGMNVWAPLFDGGTLFHVAGVNVTGGTVSLTLDTRARDTMAAWEVIQRNRESRANPARAWINQHRSSTITKDAVTEWDSIGGVITDDIHIPANGWAVFPVVAGQEGTIERIRLATTPAAEFVCAVFGKKVSPKWLHSIVPAPLTKAGTKKWQSQAIRNRLDERFLLYIAGANDQPCGYWPGQKTDTDGATHDELTGVWLDDAGFSYRTFAAPVLWVAVWADRKTRLDASPPQKWWGGPWVWGAPPQRNGRRILWNQLEAGS